MINTISDFLAEFIKVEKDFLNKQEVKHRPTIGAMFEGLSEEVLNKAVFQNLNLRIVKNSFIEGSDKEFDVLLVNGKGDKIKYTDSFKFKPENVIAVFQIKKNLFSKDFEEGYQNLNSLVDLYQNLDFNSHTFRLFRDSFRSICRKDISSQKSGELTVEEEYIFHTLKTEARLPVRVIWGYNGFSSEVSFRNKFVEYLEKNTTTNVYERKHGFGPNNFPSLIICDKYSIIKTNGMPYIGALLEDYWWPFLTTSRINPINSLLEMIWTRLTYLYDEIPTEIFGEDLFDEAHSLLLKCRIGQIKDMYGWEYSYFNMSKKDLEDNKLYKEWKPVILDETEFVIISELCEKGEIDIVNDPELEKFIRTKTSLSVTSFIENLNKKKLTYIEKNRLRLLTDNLQCAILPSGEFVAGENKSGRFSRWLIKQVGEEKKVEIQVDLSASCTLTFSTNSLTSSASANKNSPMRVRQRLER